MTGPMTLPIEHRAPSGPAGAGPATPSIRHRRADIQGLRAVAVLAVVAYHVEPSLAPGGFVGVDVFFVVSGCVIAQSILRERDRTGAVSVGGFVGRRVRRLLPALAVTLLGTLLLSLFLLSPIDSGEAVGHTARAAALSLANLQLFDATDYFGPAADANPLLHTWSLSVEEQFYAGFALVLGGWWLVSRYRGGRIVAVLAALAGAASLVACVAWTGAEPGGFDWPRFAFFGPFSRAWEFLVGVAVGVALHQGRASRLRRVGPALAAGGAVAIAAAVVLIDESTAFPGAVALVPVLGTAAVLVGGGAAPGSPVPAGLSLGVLGWIGDRSYSWYLVHWPLIVVARTYDEALRWIACGVSVLAAAALFALVEEPIRSRRWLAGVGSWRVGAVAVLVPVTAASLYLPLVGTGLGIEAVDDFDGRTEARTRGCHGDLDDPVLPTVDCTWAVEQPRGRVLLVGDSHAVSLADAVVAAGTAEGYSVTVSTRSLCPFGTRRIQRRGCAGYQRDMLERIEQLRPDVLVVAHRATLYTHTPGIDTPYSVVDGDDEPTPDQLSAVVAWEQGLGEALAQAAPHVGRIVLVDTVPEFTDPGGRATISLLRPDGDPETRERDEVLAARAPTSEVHVRLAREVPGVELFDPAPVLCPGPVCSQRDGSTWLYYDDDHVSLTGASRLEPGLRSAIAG